MSYDNNNIFAKIIRGEVPCEKIYENEFILSFYDINPQKKIHALVIPKGKYVDLDDFNSNATWTHSSDKRQKIDIKEDKLGLDFINDMKPVTFKHKSPSEFPKEWTAYDAEDKEPMGGDKTVHGLIAQEVEPLIPHAVIQSEEDGYYQMDYSKLVTPLIKAVQELSAEVEQLKQQAHEKCEN